VATTLIHALRRTWTSRFLLFDNPHLRIDQGQASPPASWGKKTKSSPFDGDRPFNPLSLALGAGATFVARTTANDMPHMTSVISGRRHTRGPRSSRSCRTAWLQRRRLRRVEQKDVRDGSGCSNSSTASPWSTGRARTKACAIGGGFTLEMVRRTARWCTTRRRDNLSLPWRSRRSSHPGRRLMGVLRAVELPTVDQLAREQERKAEKATKDRPPWRRCSRAATPGT